MSPDGRRLFWGRSRGVATLLSQTRLDRYARPIYTAKEVAAYIGIPRSTFRYWLSEERPLIQREDPNNELLSFYNLVEAHVLAAAREKHGVRVQEIRKALDYVQALTAVARPLLDKRFKTEGKYLFVTGLEVGDVAAPDRLINASNWGQYPLGMELDQYLERVYWGDADKPIKVYPRRQKNDARVIVINPRISSGRPIVETRGVLAKIIAQRYAAGDSMKELMRDYRLSRMEVETAIDYASKIEPAPTPKAA